MSTTLQTVNAQADAELRHLQTRLLASQAEASSLQKDLSTLAKRLSTLVRQVGSDKPESLDKALAAKQEELVRVKGELEARKREMELQLERVRGRVRTTSEGYEEIIQKLEASAALPQSNDQKKTLSEAKTRHLMCKEQDAALSEEMLALLELPVPAALSLPYLRQVTEQGSESGWGLALLAGVMMGVLGAPLFEVSFGFT